MTADAAGQRGRARLHRSKRPRRLQSAASVLTFKALLMTSHDGRRASASFAAAPGCHTEQCGTSRPCCSFSMLPRRPQHIETPAGSGARKRGCRPPRARASWTTCPPSRTGMSAQQQVRLDRLAHWRGPHRAGVSRVYMGTSTCSKLERTCRKRGTCLGSRTCPADPSTKSADPMMKGKLTAKLMRRTGVFRAASIRLRSTSANGCKCGFPCTSCFISRLRRSRLAVHS